MIKANIASFPAALAPAPVIEMAPVGRDTVASLRVQTERGAQNIYLRCEMSPADNRTQTGSGCSLRHLPDCSYMVDLFLVRRSKGLSRSAVSAALSSFPKQTEEFEEFEKVPQVIREGKQVTSSSGRLTEAGES